MLLFVRANVTKILTVFGRKKKQFEKAEKQTMNLIPLVRLEDITYTKVARAINLNFLLLEFIYTSKHLI